MKNLNSDVGHPFISDSLYISYSDIIDGHGVFTNSDLTPGQVVEISRLISFDNRIHRVRHPFADYFFRMDESRKISGLALGFGSLYNHSEDPNVRYKIDRDRELITYITCKHVKAGSELYISYGESWWSSRKRVPVSEKNT